MSNTTTKACHLGGLLLVDGPSVMVDHHRTVRSSQLSGLERKTRRLYPSGTRGSLYHKNLYGQVTDQTRSHDFVGDQTTFSEKHPLWKYQEDYRSGRRTRKGSNHRFLMMSDAGGPFQTAIRSYADDVRNVSLYSQSGSGQFLRQWSYDGPLFPLYDSGDSLSNTYWPAPVIPSDEVMMGLGSTAIARTIPTHPAAGLAQVLGELRQVHQLPGRELFAPRRGTSLPVRGSREYLNWEFGVKPLYSDVRKAAEAVRGTEKILSQLERDSGRLVRRRYSFPETVTTELVSQSAGAYPAPSVDISLYPGGSGVRTFVRKTTERSWFSGAYTFYYQRGGNDLAGRMKEAKDVGDYVLGLRLDPELLWNLAPWSWLLDWKTNVGEVMTNLSAFSRDGLVLRWGYLMTHRVIENIHTLTMPGLGTFTQTFKTEVKKRVKATPYGFGLDPGWQDFSTRQLAILGALGITRAS